MWETQFNHEEIKAMLTDGVSHIEISRRIGCSRERIRQLDLKYFGTTGRERQMKRALGKVRPVVMPKHPFVKDAAELGFVVESCASSRRVLVNGKTCYLRKASSHNCGNPGKSYFILHPSSQIADFYVYACGSDYLIIPAHAAPISETSISLSPMPNRGAHAFRHDYINYLNAWKLLGRPHENSKAS